jgi:hypothetical protein
MEDGTEQVGSWLGAVMAAAQGFAVDGHGPSSEGMLAGQPLADFRIQPVGIDPCKTRRIVGSEGCPQRLEP